MNSLKGIKTYEELEVIIKSMQSNGKQFLHKDTKRFTPVFSPAGVGKAKESMIEVRGLTGNKIKIENLHKYYDIVDMNEYFGSQ